MRANLLFALADTAFHSGQKLADQLGVSRATVWKQLEQLREMGVDVISRHGKGYRLPEPLRLLDLGVIRGQMDAFYIDQFSELFLFQSLASTNEFLVKRSRSSVAKQELCLAEHQFGGRGRSGRVWHSPYGKNIYGSFSWRFNQSPASLLGLSLVAGIAMHRALTGLGVENLSLKWPNDLLHDGRKLAGVLIEVHGESLGPCWVVTGIGLNVNMSEIALSKIDQPAASVEQITGRCWDKNILVAKLITSLLDAYAEFSDWGWHKFAKEWAKIDYLSGKEVSINQGDRKTLGIARGITGQGELLVEIGGSLLPLNSGEVSVKRL